MPVVVVGAPAAWAACSGPVTIYTPNLSIGSSTTTTDANGHTIGDFSFIIKNNGTTTLPAGSTYRVTITAEKAPPAQLLLVSTVSASITPAGTTRFDPDNRNGGVRSKEYTVILPAAVPPGSTFTATWSVQSDTGVGATRLRMDAILVTYSTNSCGQTTPGTSTTVTSYWGAK